MPPRQRPATDSESCLYLAAERRRPRLGTRRAGGACSETVSAAAAAIHATTPRTAIVAIAILLARAQAQGATAAGEGATARATGNHPQRRATTVPSARMSDAGTPTLTATAPPRVTETVGEAADMSVETEALEIATATAAAAAAAPPVCVTRTRGASALAAPPADTHTPNVRHWQILTENSRCF